MKAIVQDRYGPPEVLALRDVEIPAVGGPELRNRLNAVYWARGGWPAVCGAAAAMALLGLAPLLGGTRRACGPQRPRE